MKFLRQRTVSHRAIYVSHRNRRHLNWRFFCVGGCSLILVSIPSLIPLPRIFIYQLTLMRLASLMESKVFSTQSCF